MNFRLFYENYLNSKYHVLTSPSKSKWNEEFDGCDLTDTVYNIKFANGANALLKANWEYLDEDYSKPPSTRMMIILRWNATPSDAIMDKGLAAEKEYKGKGFASKVMSILLGICKKEEIDYLGIWAPSADSIAVMNHYTSIGLLTPLKWSKAELGEFYTRFQINWEKANSRI